MITLLSKKTKKKERFLHKNIVFLLAENRLDLKSLSEESGIPLTSLFRMKEEGHNPTLPNLEPLAEFFRIDLTELLYADLASVEYQSKKKIGTLQYIPAINYEDLTAAPLSFSNKIFVGAVGLINDNSFGLIINNKSLMPAFYQHSVLIIDPELKPKEEDYVLCTLGEDKMPLMRQLFLDGSNHLFKPINPNYGDMAREKLFNIFGVVVKSIENYR